MFHRPPLPKLFRLPVCYAVQLVSFCFDLRSLPLFRGTVIVLQVALASVVEIVVLSGGRLPRPENNCSNWFVLAVIVIVIVVGAVRFVLYYRCLPCSPKVDGLTLLTARFGST